jgi:hypothetical protein
MANRYRVVLKSSRAEKAGAGTDGETWVGSGDASERLRRGGSGSLSPLVEPKGFGTEP